MDTIRLRAQVRSEILAHAADEAPSECCGLLVGVGSVIDECVRVRNIDPAPSRYHLDPAAHIATNRRLRGTGRVVLGCYHSHPHTTPVPSASDYAEALYPEFVWMIVSLAAPGPAAVAAYRLTPGRFVPVTIEDAP